MSAMRRRALVVVWAWPSQPAARPSREPAARVGDRGRGDATEPVELTCGDPPAFPAARPGRRGRRAGRDRRRRRGAPRAPRVGPVDSAAGWHRVAESADEVRFVSEPARRTCAGRRSSTATATSGSRTSGASASSLPTARASSRPNGSRRGRWRPGAKRLRLAVTERGCASGEPPGDRLQPAEVVEACGSVTVTFWVRDAGRRPDCPGNPPTMVTVELAEPLDDRVLLDGGIYPAREIGGEEPVAPTTNRRGAPGDDRPDQHDRRTDRAATGRSRCGEGGHRRDVPPGLRRGRAGRRSASPSSRTAASSRRRAKRPPRSTPRPPASISVTVHSVTFVDATHAAVNFELLYEDAMLLGPQDGEAVFVDGRWKVSRGPAAASSNRPGWRARDDRCRSGDRQHTSSDPRGRDRLAPWHRPWSRCAHRAAGRSSWCSKSDSSSGATATASSSPTPACPAGTSHWSRARTKR